MQKCHHQNKNLHKTDGVAFIICLIFFKPSITQAEDYILRSPQGHIRPLPDLHIESGPSEGRDNINMSGLCSGAMVYYCSYQSFALLWCDFLNLLQEQGT